MPNYDVKNFTFGDLKNAYKFCGQTRDALKNNSFFSQLIESNKARSAGDCYNMAASYVNMFDDPENPDPAIGKLAEAIQQFIGMHTNINIATDYNTSKEERDMATEKAMGGFFSLTHGDPTFEKMVSDFAKNHKGVFIGDEGMRVLNSMVQVADSVSANYDMALSSMQLDEWKANKQEFDRLGLKMQSSVDSFVNECIANKLNPSAFIDDMAKEESEINKLKEELTATESKEENKQYSDAYNECAKRVNETYDQMQALLTEGEKLEIKQADLADLDGRLKALESSYNGAKGWIEQNTNRLQAEERKLKDMEAEVASIEQRNAAYKEGQEYLKTMGRLPQTRIRAMNMYIRDNEATQRELDKIDYLGREIPGIKKKAIDISDSYRQLRSGDLGLSEMDPEQRGAVELYLEAKRGLLENNPSLQEEFMKYEDDPANKIPGDFDKVMGANIKDRIKANQEFVKQVQDADYYKNYMQAKENVAKGMADSSMLDFLKSTVEQKKQNIEKMRDNLESRTQEMKGIENRVRTVLGDKCPAEITNFADLKKITAGAKKELNAMQTQNNSKMFKLSQVYANENKRLMRLHEGLKTSKITTLKGKIKVHEQKLAKLQNMSTKKNELFKDVENYAKEGKTLKEKSSTINPGAAYDKVTNRLEYIKDHFNDVQSFWSRGMSKTCKQMYDQLTTTINILKQPDSTREQKEAALTTLSEQSNVYIAEKNAQNRSKTFASDQRFWRLSFAEEMVNMKDVAVNALNDLESKNSAARSFDSFMRNDFEKILKNPGHAVKNLLENSARKHLADSISKTGPTNEIKGPENPNKTTGGMTAGM